MKSQLFIPQKIKVGYQKRDDTYTKRLAYVIYFDLKGVLRKEKSWKGWITPQLGTPEFDNKPTEGFVLNKDVGGVRNSWSSWNQRMEKVRVYDPRGFEFEINIPNLLYILQECTSTKGKGLEGEFIYAWDGPELILLPVVSQEYKDCAQYTSIQGNKVTSKEMVEGHVYMTKKQETWIYMGKHKWTTSKYTRASGYKTVISTNERHIFYDEKNKMFIAEGGFTKLAAKVGDLVTNYADIMDKLQENAHISIPVGLELRNKKFTEKYDSKTDWYRTIDGEGFKLENGKYVSYSFSNQTNYDNKNGKYTHKGYTVQESQIVKLENGAIVTDYSSRSYGYGNLPTKSLEDINKMDFKDLYVVMKNGKKIKFSNYNLY